MARYVRRPWRRLEWAINSWWRVKSFPLKMGLLAPLTEVFFAWYLYSCAAGWLWFLKPQQFLLLLREESFTWIANYASLLVLALFSRSSDWLNCCTTIIISRPGVVEEYIFKWTQGGKIRMDLRCLYYKLAQIGWQRVLYWNRSVQSWMGNFTKQSARGGERRKHLFFVHRKKDNRVR